MVLPVVLHPDVINFLRSYQNSNLQKSVWKCIEKLKKQQFDGGLRAKKIKLSEQIKTIWEARINKASRLTYTPHSAARQMNDSSYRQKNILAAINRIKFLYSLFGVKMI